MAINFLEHPAFHVMRESQPEPLQHQDYLFIAGVNRRYTGWLVWITETICRRQIVIITRLSLWSMEYGILSRP
jgi:hypothetical protein